MYYYYMGVYLQQHKRRMILKGQIQAHSGDEAYSMALSGIMQFNPKPTENLNMSAARVFLPEHLMDQLSVCWTTMRRVASFPSERGHPHTSPS
jgi:hypothetical protein